MFPFLFLAERIYRYFQQQNGSDCPPPPNPSPAPGQGPTAPNAPASGPNQNQSNQNQSNENHPNANQADRGFFQEAADFLRGLGRHARRAFRPLTVPLPPVVTRDLPELVWPWAQEGSTFLPDHMPQYMDPVTRAVLEFGVDLSLGVFIGAFPVRAGARAARAVWDALHQEGHRKIGPIGYYCKLPQRTFRSVTLHRLPLECREPNAPVCR